MIAPADATSQPVVRPFFDAVSNTITYLVQEPTGPACAIIDSVMDFDYASGRTSTAAADTIIAAVLGLGLRLEWLIETHLHADHISAAHYIKNILGGRIGVGEGIADIQQMFGRIFNEGSRFQRDGSQFDRLFADGDRYTIGDVVAEVLHTPGHTPACTTHVIGDAAFVGDTLFMPDGGTARADFPGGDAKVLYASIRRVLSLPLATRLFICHDYGPGGRAIAWETTVAEQRASNIHMRDGVGEAEFVSLRQARDRSLAMPRLIIPSIQVNMHAGRLPEPDESGLSFLKVPLNAF